MKANEIVNKIKNAKIGKEVLDIWQDMHGTASMEDAIHVHRGAYEEIMKSLETVYPTQQGWDRSLHSSK